MTDLEIIRQIEDMRISRSGYCSIHFKNVDGYMMDLKMTISPERAETLKLKFPMIIKFKLTKRVPPEGEKYGEGFLYDRDHIKIMGIEERHIKRHKAEGQTVESTQYVYRVSGGNITLDLHFDGCIISEDELPLELYANYFVEMEQVFQEG